MSLSWCRVTTKLERNMCDDRPGVFGPRVGLPPSWYLKYFLWCGVHHLCDQTCGTRAIVEVAYLWPTKPYKKFYLTDKVVSLK